MTELERKISDICKKWDKSMTGIAWRVSDDELHPATTDFIEVVAIARADGAAEERNKLVKIIEEQIGRIPTNGGIMDIFMGDDGFIGKWIDRDILLEALTTKEHHAS